MLKEYKSYKRRKKKNYLGIGIIISLIFLSLIVYISRQNIKNLFLSDNETIILRHYQDIESNLLKKQRVGEKKYEYVLENLDLVLEQKPQYATTYFSYAKYYFYLLLDYNLLFFNKENLIKISQNQVELLLNEKNLYLIENLFMNLLKAKAADSSITQNHDYKFLLFFRRFILYSKEFFSFECPIYIY